MPLPDLDVLAEGDLPTGQHWILKAGGTSADEFYTFLETCGGTVNDHLLNSRRCVKRF